jgi:hypothetical protein
MDPIASSRWLSFVLASFASYRVAHLLAREDGPGALVYRLRQRLGASFFGSLMDCMKCVSVWVAAPFAYFVAGAHVLDWFVTWLALSGCVCWLDELGQRAVSPTPPVVIERFVDQEVPSELLRTEAGRAERTNAANGADKRQAAPP